THRAHSRESVTVSGTPPISRRVLTPRSEERRVGKESADSRGSGPDRLVAFVGNGTVRVVLPVSAVARACARSIPPRVKFTTGSPKPPLVKPCPTIENDVGALARSIELGVIPVTHRAHGGEPVTVSGTPPISMRVLTP